MSKPEEKIEYYQGRVDDLIYALDGPLFDKDREVKEAMMGCYKTILADLQSLTLSHREEIEALERKAWECSVEMMKNHRDHMDSAENPLKGNHRSERESGIAYGWKMAAYKLRDTFGFSGSETPDRFKK